MDQKQQEIEKTIIETCIRIGRRGEGSIIVLGQAKYKPLVEQNINSFNIINNPKLLESLALMDGAVVVKLDGYVESYGVKLENNLKNVLMNFGTRHSAGMYASQTKGTTVFVVSEEDRKVRIFKEGKIILEVDSMTKGIEKKTSEIEKIMESVGWGTTASVVGAGLLAPVFGVVVFSGATVFVTVTGISYFVKKATQWGWFKK